MSTRERWRRIEEILDELLELPPGERLARLDQLSPSDSDLRTRVISLLEEDESAGGLLDTPFDHVAAAVLDDDAGVAPMRVTAGHRIGPYRVVRELGRGGMGVVYLAERAEGEFDQQVALKIVSGGARESIVARLRHERQILARLRHPNIAALHDGGATDDGLPYFAMEYVDGLRITEYCDRNGLNAGQRLRLFEFVCEAVQYAHRNLVIHRDLKPANVLVTKSGTVKLLDFGVAKIVDPESTHGVTTTRGFLTPAYASPEQILGEPTSTATDVYSLGVLLYELLTGRNPHGDTSRSVEMARSILESDPPSASAAVSPDLARTRGATAESLRRTLRGDLDNVLQKALRKTPEDRYASAEELRADLERYRHELPVQARPATLRYRLGKFVRRHRAGAAALVATAVTLVLGVVGIAWQAGVAASERDRARAEAQRARAVKEYLLEVFSAADPTYETGETLTAVELVERGAERVGGRFENDPAVKAEVMTTLGSVLVGLAAYERADTLLAEALAENRALGNAEGVVETLAKSGEAARWRGELDEAVAFLEEALAVARSHFGDVDPVTANTLAEYGTMLGFRSDYEAAEKAAREAIRIQESIGGPEDRRISGFLTILGWLAKEKGDIPQAVVHFERSLEIAEATGMDGDHLAGVLSSLAENYKLLDRLEEAEELSRRAVEVFRQEYGADEHPKLAIGISNLASTVRQLGRYEEAESLQREAIEIFRATLGDDHYYLAVQYNNLAATLKQMDRLEEAEPLQAEAIRITRDQLGEHRALLAPMNNHAGSLIDLGRLDEAEAEYREAIRLAKKLLGEDHFEVSYPVLGLATVHRERGELVESERLTRQAWELRKATLGPGHSQELVTRIRVAELVADRGDPGGGPAAPGLRHRGLPRGAAGHGGPARLGPAPPGRPRPGRERGERGPRRSPDGAAPAPGGGSRLRGRANRRDS